MSPHRNHRKPAAAAARRFRTGSSGISATSFPDWETWEAGYKQLEAGIARYAAFKGTLAEGPDRLLAAFRLSEELGQLAYRVWYFPSLRYDEDQRDNTVNAKRQQVQILFAQLEQARSWFNPELLRIPLETVRQWMEASEPLRLYKFAIEDLYRQQEHVLDEAGERLMSLSSRLASAPNEAYWALSTADAKFPDDHAVERRDGHGLVRPISRDSRHASRTGRPRGGVQGPARHLSKLAEHLRDALQRRLPARLVSGAGARLREHARSGAQRRQHSYVGRREPDRNHASGRRAAAAVSPAAPAGRSACPRTTCYDFSIPLVTFDKKYDYDQVLDWIVASVAPLGPEYQARMREGFAGGWIDVYENDGKRSGAYSAPVYGTHPYMLLNYTDTLDDVFTLAHEMGHSMHTILSHETQPFIYSSYTIFVAEVPSTLSEALLLEYMLAHSTDPAERIVLLQHAIDNITSTFYTQVMFADFELRAHRLAEQDQPITAEILTETYRGLLDGLLRRRARPERADGHHLGAHPALLQLAVLRLPVRHLLRVSRADLARDHARNRAGRKADARTLPDAAACRAATTIRWSS